MIDTEKMKITDFLSRGTKEEILLKKITAASLVMIFIYKMGYAAGVTLCHIGL